MTHEIKEQYQKLLEFVRMAENNQSVDLKEMLNTNLRLFFSMKEVFESGSEEEKKEALYILSQAFQLFASEAKKNQVKTGLSEQEMLQVGENPNFFTPEQWKLIQEAQKEIETMGSSLVDLLQKKVTLPNNF